MGLRRCFVTSLLSWTLLRYWVSTSPLANFSDLNTNLVLLGKLPRSSPAVLRLLIASFSLLFFSLIAGLKLSIRKLKIVGTAFFLSTIFCSKLSSVNCSVQTKNSFKFSAFVDLTKSDVTSFISDNFPNRSTVMKNEKLWFWHSNISEMFRPIRLKLQNMFSLYLMNTLDSNEKNISIYFRSSFEKILVLQAYTICSNCTNYSWFKIYVASTETSYSNYKSLQLPYHL